MAASPHEERAIEHLIKVYNTELVFRNCRFSITSFYDVLKSYIYAEDTLVTFENCTYRNDRAIPIYSSPQGPATIIKDGSIQISNNGIWMNIKGNYNELPKRPPIGFSYFCQNCKVEGDYGIMIYYKGNDTWVDALGRTVNDPYS